MLRFGLKQVEEEGKDGQRQLQSIYCATTVYTRAIKDIKISKNIVRGYLSILFVRSVRQSLAYFNIAT